MLSQHAVPPSVLRIDSGILKTVRKARRLDIFLAIGVTLCLFTPPAIRGFRSRLGFASARQQVSPLTQKPPSGQTTAPAAVAPQQPSTNHKLQTIVLDPAHGGTDEGAHGSSGVLEKDVDLTLALSVRARLQQEGFNVVMTRTDDRTLSFRDRAAIANAQSNAVFITLHVGSSEPVGSAFAYYYDFNRLAGPPIPVSGGLLPWNESQRAFEPQSHRLAQLIQVELSGRFRGAPELPSSAEVYQLRSIAEPAVALEVESVNVPNAASLESLAVPLAQSLSSAIRSFASVYVPEER